MNNIETKFTWNKGVKKPSKYPAISHQKKIKERRQAKRQKNVHLQMFYIPHLEINIHIKLICKHKYLPNDIYDSLPRPMQVAIWANNSGDGFSSPRVAAIPDVTPMMPRKFPESHATTIIFAFMFLFTQKSSDHFSCLLIPQFFISLWIPSRHALTNAAGFLWWEASQCTHTAQRCSKVRHLVDVWVSACLGTIAITCQEGSTRDGIQVIVLWWVICNIYNQG